MSEHETTKNNSGEPTRRDFLFITTGAVATVGTAAFAWPFINQMNPDAATLAAGEPVEIDVSAIEPGGSITIKWRGKPYFIRRLTADERAASNELSADDMKKFEPVGDRLGGPEGSTDAEWTVVSANCTHLGCVPKTINTQPEGWHCPCHGSVFDMTGRILRGPANENLPLPPYVFASASKLIVGTDKAGA